MAITMINLNSQISAFQDIKFTPHYSDKFPKAENYYISLHIDDILIDI